MITPKGSYFDTIIWKHPRGDAEYVGTHYAEYLGVGSHLDTGSHSGLIFNEVRVPFYILEGGEVQSYKVNIYVRHFGAWETVKSIDSLTLIESFTVDGTEFNADPDGYQTITLADKFHLNANDSLVVLALPVSGSVKLGMRHWNNVASSNPTRLNGSVTNDAAGLDAGKTWTAIYYQVPMLLSLSGLIPEEINSLKGLRTNVARKLRKHDAEILALQASTEPTSIIRWQHPRADAEAIGSNYSEYPGVGVAIDVDEQSGITFDEIRVPFYAVPGGENEIYNVLVARKAFGSWRNDRQINTLVEIESFVISGSEFNRDPDGVQVITLTESYTLSDNDSLVILVMTESGIVNIGARNWATDVSSSPARLPMFYTEDPDGMDAGKTWTGGFYCVPAILSTSTLIPEDTNRLKGLSTYLPNLLFKKSDKPSARLALPSNIYVPIDTELNIWNDALVFAYGDNVNVNYTCDIGSSKERCFRVTPDATGTDSLVIKVMDQNNNIIDQKTITVNSVAKDNGSGTKQILVIGDSLTVAANGSVSNIPVTELRTLINTDGGFTPLFLGTQGSAPALHEGYGGYAYSHFIGTSSPFYDGTRINFKDWMSDNSNFGGSDTIDFVIVQLGVNDVSSLLNNPLYTKVSGVETIITNIKTLIDKILDATYGYPSAKIIINLPPISGNTKDGFAVIGSGDTKQNRELLIRMLWERMVEEFDESAYSAQVRLGISGLMIDRKYGYQRSLTNVSARETAQEYEHINSVHPYDSGYKQIADAFYSALRGWL